DDLVAGWCDPACRRPVATYPDQEGLPAALPLAIELSRPEMAARKARRLRHGARARYLLPGVLLVPDDPVVLWRHHEPVLDRRSGWLCLVGEDDPDGPLDRTGRRCRLRRMGCGDAGQRGEQFVTGERAACADKPDLVRKNGSELEG